MAFAVKLWKSTGEGGIESKFTGLDPASTAVSKNGHVVSLWRSLDQSAKKIYTIQWAESAIEDFERHGSNRRNDKRGRRRYFSLLQV